MKYLKKFIFRSLSLENYLRILQSGFFFLYHTKLLKLNNRYSFHYFAKGLIHKGDVIIDIGANLGYYSLLFARWTGKTGIVYAVEPIKIYNKIFNEKARKFSQIRLYPYALGCEEKTIDMVSSPRTGYLRTGLLHMYDEQKDGAIENVEFRFEAQMKNPLHLFAALDRVDYIKCDIEGFEYVVLSEMKEIINRYHPKVQVEIWKGIEKQTSDMFKSMGYVQCRLINNHLAPAEAFPNVATKGDFLFIHKNQIGV